MLKALKISSFNIGAVFAVSFFVAASSVLALAPRKISVTKADNCAQTFGTTPIFNPYPVDNSTNSGCTDYSFIRSRVNGGTFSPGDVTANPGDTVEVALYIHNGAVENGGQTAVNEYVKAVVDLSQNTSHWVSAEAGASNAANTLGGSFTIQTPSNSSLQVVPGSEQWYQSVGNTGAAAQFQGNLSVVNTTASMPDQQACFTYARFVYFKLQVVGQPAGPTQSQTTGSIHASINSNVCPATIHVTWTTQNAVAVAAYNNTTGKMISGEWNNDMTDSDVTPGQSYSYSIWNVDWNQSPPTKLSQIGSNSETVQVPINNCNPTPPTVCSPHNSGTVNIGDVFNVRATGGDGFYTVTANDGTSFSFGGYGTNIYSGTFSTAGSKTVTVTSAGTSDTCTVQVSQPAATPTINSFNATFQCPSTGNISWSTSNVNNVRVFVKTNNNAEQDFANLPSGNQTVDWVKPGSTYVFRLTGDGITDRTQTLSPASNACGTTPTPTVNSFTAGNFQCPSNATISWSTTNVNNVRVFVTTNNNAQQDFANLPSGNQTVDWVKPGSTYVFKLTGDGISDQLQTLSPASNACTSAPVCTAPTSASINAPASVSPNQNFNLSCDFGSANDFIPAPSGCTFTARSGSTANFSCTAPSSGSATYTCQAQNQTGFTNFCSLPSAVSKTVTVTQAPINGVCGSANNTSLSSAPSGAALCSAGSASTVAGNGPWNWSCNASNGGSPAFCNASAIAPSTLSCVSSPSTIDAGQQVVFTATGGSGNNSWSTNNFSSATPSATGNSFNVVYNSGTANSTQSATVTSGSQSANCSVRINPINVQQGVVQLAKEVRNVTNNEDFKKITFAKAGDVLEYRISVWADSSVTLTNVLVTDTQQSGLVFQDGSLTLDGSSHSAGLSSGGITLPSVDTVKKVFKYRYSVPNNSTAQNVSVQNTATARAQNANNTATDQALVTINNPVAGQPSLTILKQVKNTGPSQITGFSSSVNAVRGDTASFQVTVNNSGSVNATNVFVSDSMPSSSIQNLHVSVAYTGTWPNGISLGTLAPNQSVTITYNIPINQDSGSIQNTATVSATNVPTQNSTAVVNITAQQNNGGGTVINNNINTNTCVNNSCNTTINNSSSNTYYYASSNNPVPANNYLQLGIRKLVRNVNGGTFQKSVTVNNGDLVQFEIDVTNTGNQPVNNVTLTDGNINGLAWQANSTQIDGNTVYNWNGNNLSLGTMFSGQTKRVTFTAQVVAGSNASIQNVASVYGDNVPSRQDDAWVFVNTGNVLGSNVSLTFSKRANNDTKNADATTIAASREDFITYTLTATNNGNTPASNFIITDDLSQVLAYADMVDNGGGSLTGSVISYPGLTVPQNGSVQKSFRVRVKFSLANNLHYTMTNTYGNTIIININTPQVLGAFVAPKTGAETNAFAFAGMLTAAFALAHKRKYLMSLLVRQNII